MRRKLFTDILDSAVVTSNILTVAPYFLALVLWSLFSLHERSTPSLTPSPSPGGRGEQTLALRDQGTLKAEQRVARSAG